MYTMNVLLQCLITVLASMQNYTYIIHIFHCAFCCLINNKVAGICKLLTYCVLRSTQPPTLRETGNG